MVFADNAVVYDLDMIKKDGLAFYWHSYTIPEFAWVFSYPSLKGPEDYVSKVSQPYEIGYAESCVKTSIYLTLVDRSGEKLETPQRLKKVFRKKSLRLTKLEQKARTFFQRLHRGEMDENSEIFQHILHLLLLREVTACNQLHALADFMGRAIQQKEPETALSCFFEHLLAGDLSSNRNSLDVNLDDHFIFFGAGGEVLLDYLRSLGVRDVSSLDDKLGNRNNALQRATTALRLVERAFDSDFLNDEGRRVVVERLGF